MNMNRFFTLFKREILDILRDKKTLVMMIVIPMLLYPTIILGMAFVMTAMVNSEEEKTYYVSFDQSATEYEEALKTIIKTEKKEIGYTLEVLRAEDCEKSLQDKVIDAYLSVNDEGIIEICYLSAKTRSQTAQSALKTVLGIYKDELREKNIKELNLDVDYILNPIQYETEDLSTAEESVGNIMGQILPFMIITSILLGAMYPSIDVTAGEKERGTLETLLTLPITNVEMIASKFLAVSVLAVFSALLNILSMVGAIGVLVSSSLAASANIEFSFSLASFVPGILFSMLVMSFFAMLVTALCMCACVFAKSFKEANNYLTPIMLVIMFLSYAPMLPDVELTAQTACIPVVNVALMIEALFGFQYDYQLFAIVLFTNVSYSFLTIFVLSKIYNSEAILFAEGFTSVKIFEKRSNMKAKQMPQFGDLVLLASVSLLLMFYAGSLISAKFPSTAIYITQVILIGSVLFYLWYIKADYKKLLSIKAPKIRHLIGAVLLWVSSYIFALILGNVLAPYFKESTLNLMELEEYMKSIHPVLLFICLAILPPICEETFFRGFIMGTLKNKYKALIAILVTAFIFAAYHMSLIKMFTVGIIGLGFTFCAYYSDSIFVSMLMHFLNNGLAYLMMMKPDWVKMISQTLEDEKMQIFDYIVFPVILFGGFILGIYLYSDKIIIKKEKYIKDVKE